MRNFKLLDLFNFIDDKLVEKSIETDSAEKLKEIKILEKKKKVSAVLKFVSAFAGGFAVLIFEFMLFSNPGINNNSIQNSNPIEEVSQLSELEKFINKNLSKYKIKSIDKMIKYVDEKMIEIEYKDSSTLRISKDHDDNSGIYGATLKEEKNINNTNVKIYEFEDLTYAVWSSDNYSYSYTASSSEDMIKVLIEII